MKITVTKIVGPLRREEIVPTKIRIVPENKAVFYYLPIIFRTASTTGNARLFASNVTHVERDQPLPASLLDVPIEVAAGFESVTALESIEPQAHEEVIGIGETGDYKVQGRAIEYSYMASCWFVPNDFVFSLSDTTELRSASSDWVRFIGHGLTFAL